MPIIVIVGPTGIGKTRLSIELAHLFNGEIINADSTQIYQGLDIATAKVKKEEMKNIKHHLLSIKAIDHDYTVFDYQQDARKAIDKIKSLNKTPIMVGGTGLYIKSTLYDYKFTEEQKSSRNYEEISTTELFSELITISPNTKIHPNNRKRIIRALDYYFATGLDPDQRETTNKLLYDVVVVGLTTTRTKLYELIDSRVDLMLDSGLIEEARQLYQTKIRTKAVMTPIGYKELFDYFDEKVSLDDAIALIKQRSRNYAKRQYTWFNNQMDVKWFEVNVDNFEQTILNVSKYIQTKIND